MCSHKNRKVSTQRSLVRILLSQTGKNNTVAHTWRRQLFCTLQLTLITPTSLWSRNQTSAAIKEGKAISLSSPLLTLVGMERSSSAVTLTTTWLQLKIHFIPVRVERSISNSAVWMSIPWKLASLKPLTPTQSLNIQSSCAAKTCAIKSLSIIKSDKSKHSRIRFSRCNSTSSTKTVKLHRCNTSSSWKLVNKLKRMEWIWIKGKS